MSLRSVSRLLVIFCIGAYALAIGQISGTVKDKTTNAGLSGVTVLVVKSKKTTTTSATGTFTLSPASISFNMSDRLNSIGSQENLTFSTEKSTNVSIDIFNVNGKKVSSYKQSVGKGTWRVTPGSLTSGVYVCQITTDKKLSPIKFVATQNQNSSTGLMSTNEIESKTAKITAVVDTLRFTKTGYTKFDTLLSSYNATGMIISMSVTPVAPAAPTGLKAVAGDASITLTWNAVLGATSYNLYRGASAGGEPATPTVTNITTTTYNNTGLTNGTTYFYKVAAVNVAGVGAQSAEVSAAPKATTTSVPDMVQIPAGSFQMGDQTGGSIDPIAVPVHTATISECYMDKYETYWGQWVTVTNWGKNNGYTFNSGTKDCTSPKNVSGENADRHPVTHMNWIDAVKYCNARSEMLGFKPCYYNNSAKTTVYKNQTVDIQNDWVDWSANGFRLPTEAEWERASRGGVAGQVYPWGNSPDNSKANATNSGDPWDKGNHNGDHPDPNYVYEGETSPVGYYPPNAYGLYDMEGNVSEWCWDRGDANWYSNSACTAKDTRGPATGLNHNSRGRSCDDGQSGNAWRGSQWMAIFDINSGNRDIDFGCRTVRNSN